MSQANRLLLDCMFGEIDALLLTPDELFSVLRIVWSLAMIFARLLSNVLLCIQCFDTVGRQEERPACKN